MPLCNRFWPLWYCHVWLYYWFPLHFVCMSRSGRDSCSIVLLLHILRLSFKTMVQCLTFWWICQGNELELESNMCHQCQRNDKGRVVRCLQCKRKRYCVHCMTRWYKTMNEYSTKICVWADTFLDFYLSFWICVMWNVGILRCQRRILLSLAQFVVIIAIANHACAWMYHLK